MEAVLKLNYIEGAVISDAQLTFELAYFALLIAYFSN